MLEPLLDAAVRLLRPLATPGDTPILAQLAEREILHRLVRVRPKWTASPLTFSMACARTRHRPRRVTAFIECLRAEPPAGGPGFKPVS